ncbi:MAG: hypothetical protein WBP81_28330, partial [Solirubrobacteraceae bacterium]
EPRLPPPTLPLTSAVSAGVDVTPLGTSTRRPRERSARYCNPRVEEPPDGKSKPLRLALWNEAVAQTKPLVRI